MLKRNMRVFLILALLLSLVIPSFLSFVSSSSGLIRINSKTASAPGQQVQAGENLNLYFGGVTWSGEQFWLFLSTDGSSQISGSLFTPIFSVYDVADTVATHAYNDTNGLWITGNDWVNGTIPTTSSGGNYYIKAVDQIGSAVAVTDTYFTINPILYDSTLTVSPSSGPGGIPITFTGSNYPPGQPVTISYRDPAFSTWHYLTSVTANSTGQISVTSEAPDLQKSMGAYDSSEIYTEISYRAEGSNYVYGYANYLQYHRGLKQVGDSIAYGLYGNGTNLVSNVRLMTGDEIEISGKWFHSNDAIYIRWDGVNVVGTVTSDEWASAEIIGTTTANSNGAFSTSVTIPTANAGEHYIAVEDSQTRVTVKIFVSSASLQLTPASGPGGTTVQFTGSGYPASTPVTISYLDSSFGQWNIWTTTTANSQGQISVSTEIPDLMKTSNGEFSNASSTLSFRTEVGGVPYSYVDYTQFWRGLSRVGNQVPSYGLYGNGTNLSSTVSVAPGSSLMISGSWFHPGVVYVRFDGFNVVGTVTGNEWLTAQVIGTTTASATGSFSTTVTIPSASGGQHYLAIEDSQTRLIAIIDVNAPIVEPTPTPTISPTASPTVAPTPTPNPSLPTPSIDLFCKSGTLGSGFKVEINGELALDGSPLVDQPVLISYSVTGGTEWNSLTLVRTLSDGGFSAVWIPDVTGDLLVKATVEATSTMNAGSKTVNLAITPDPENNLFTINSNSTIRQFDFNPESKELSFTVEGATGTTGYVDIFIPKAILSDISELKAFMDDTEISFSSQSVSDSWLISFTYSHSIHRVTLTIGSIAVQPTEQPDDASSRQWPIYIAIVATVVAVATIATVALKRKSKNI